MIFPTVLQAWAPVLWHPSLLVFAQFEWVSEVYMNIYMLIYDQTKYLITLVPSREQTVARFHPAGVGSRQKSLINSDPLKSTWKTSSDSSSGPNNRTDGTFWTWTCMCVLIIMKVFYMVIELLYNKFCRVYWSSRPGSTMHQRWFYNYI